MKKVTIWCLILTFLLTTGCGCDKKNKETTKKPTSEEKDKKNKTNENQEELGKLPDKEVDGIKFTDASISFVDDMSTLVATVTNTKDQAVTLEVFDIIIKDKKGEEITTIPGFIPEKIEPNSTHSLVAYTNMDLTLAYDIEYKF